MSTLQWALLLLGVGIAIALIFSSRREKRWLERHSASPAAPATRDWSVEHEPMTGPAAPAPRAAPASGQAAFDEFGVSKPRTLRRGSGQARVAPEIAAAPMAGNNAAGGKVAEKLIGLYIAEHEGTNILGPKIHAALQAHGLRYGMKRIYHRYEGEQPVFSVASLVKPGALDPAEAEGFATPGLSVFIVLPGPARPTAAFQDMLDTARGLAKALNAELYDSEQRAPLTAERERALQAQVEEWTRQDKADARPGA